ncbi:TetR family transcriptional regulator [Nocardioides sp. Soil777]|uniref:TetR family transcriptional regulator n=1 Tax=Nocardioides sp. Soil777 TaxID=1736409 RepID=UPI001F2F5639|nr:TetR family transcriptional regulator [Nocardioides sp. Soil777]
MANDDPASPVQRERRTRILDTTIALASQGGFDAVQMRAVAEQADVALGTLYRYFPSKIHLLVTALAREFERADAAMASHPVPGDTRADRVIHLLRSLTRGLQDDQHLTEALTRAFMFADRSARQEINGVGLLLIRMLTRAMEPESVDQGSGGAGPTDEGPDEDAAIARVIADVWLAALMAWVTGRSSAEETSAHMERAVRLILR